MCSSWMISDAMEEKIAARGGVAVVLDAQANVSKQTSDIEDAVARGAALIMANALDSGAIIGAIKAANRAGIPFVTVGRKLSEPSFSTPS